MMPAGALRVAMRTDRGVVRASNEDTIFADAGLGLAILADGMGGYQAGEVASGMAVSGLSEEIGEVAQMPGNPGVEDVEAHIVDSIGLANWSIYNASHTVPHYAGMGTTLVMAWFHGSRMSVAHVGDSRLYRLRGGVFEQLTHDHSLLQEQIDNGFIKPEEAPFAVGRNLLTRALGVEPTVIVDVRTFDTRAGDLVLLCSDGLTDMLSDEQIAQVLVDQGQKLQEAADYLACLANEHGGRDNVSVILIAVDAETPAPERGWRRLWRKFTG